MDKIYQLRYLPLFYADLEQAVMYISNVLQNPQSAVKLIDDTEKAIQERLNHIIPTVSVNTRITEYRLETIMCFML